MGHQLPYVIQNSGGRTSAYMTEELLKDEFIRSNSIISFQNTGKENDATLDFVNNCDMRWQSMFGVSVVWLEYTLTTPQKFRIVDYKTAHRTGDKSKPSPFEELIIYQSYVPNIMARFCTSELKIRTLKRYIISMGIEYWTSIIGIRYDEPNRWAKTKDIDNKDRWDVWMPLVDWRTTKPDVLSFWKNMPFDLQLKDYEGNCDLCFLKGIGKKRMIIRENPESADWWIRMEKETGATFKNGYSYESIAQKIKKQPEFKFDINAEPDIECFCNID